MTARKTLAFLVLYLIGGYGIYAAFGHRVIASIYDGGANPAFRWIIQGQATIPLSAYLEKADRLFIRLHLLAGAIGFLAVLQLQLGLFSTASARSRGPRGVIDMPAGQVTLVLFCVFAFAFLQAPYWTLLPIPIGRVMALISLAIAGFAWASAAAAAVRLDLTRVSAWAIGMLTAALLAVNLRALGADLLWRGDEGYHVATVIDIVHNPAWVAAVIVTVIAVGYGDTRRTSRLIVLCGALAAILAVDGSFYDYQAALIRYPFFSRWLEAAAVQPFAFSSVLLAHEGLFRVVPFLSVVAVAAIVFAACETPSAALRAGFALAIATVPLLVYFASALYLELPAVALMILVVYDIDALARADREAVRRRPAWIALLLIGFIKETVLPFLAAVIICRALVRTWMTRHDPRRARSAIDEMRIAATIVAPLAVYLAFRRLGGWDSRPYGAHFAALADPALIGVLLRSWIEQFGSLLPLAAAGLVLMAWRRRYVSVGFSLLVLLIVPAFHIIDEPGYVGYSRFNLFIMPPLVAAASCVFCEVLAQRRLAAATVLAGALAANVVGSPIASDGARRPRWGSPVGDIADHSFPYRDALQWLSTRHRDDRLLVTGLTYDYSIDFYLRRFAWHPRLETQLLPESDPDRASTIRRVLADAASAGVAAVLFHPVPGDDVRAAARAAGYRVEHVFVNSAHELYVLAR